MTFTLDRLSRFDRKKPLIARVIHDYFMTDKAKKEEAADRGIFIGEELRRAFAIDRPGLPFKYEVDANSHGFVAVDVTLGEGDSKRWIVVEYSPRHKQYGCSDCTDADDCMYGEGVQFAYDTSTQVLVWFRRHVKWLMK